MITGDEHDNGKFHTSRSHNSDYDENKQKYLKYTYKTDYTKPKETKYYHCKKI